MIVALLLYAWCVGVRSSRAVARLTWNDVAFRVVAADNHPHFTTLAEFRRTHSSALAGLFEQVLVIAMKFDLVALRHVAVDGTKIQGNASKHKAMSYERMKTTRERLKAEILSILEDAEATDLREDAEFGEDKDGTERPEELRRRETRIAAIERAMKELEDEAREARAVDLREQAERADLAAVEAPEPRQRKAAVTRAKKRRAQADALAPSDDDDDDTTPPFTTSEGLPKNRPPRTPEGKPKPKAQRNFTDPDSRIMERGGAFLQGYNPTVPRCARAFAGLRLARLSSTTSARSSSLAPRPTRRPTPATSCRCSS